MLLYCPGQDEREMKSYLRFYIDIAIQCQVHVWLLSKEREMAFKKRKQGALRF